MLNLVPLYGQECVNEFRKLVPIQYRPGLTPLDKLDNLSKQDFFLHRDKIWPVDYWSNHIQAYPIQNLRAK